MTVICPNCQATVAAGPQCGACGSLVPVPPGANFFEVLGVPASFDLDSESLEDRIKELQKTAHPDRFAQKPPAQRRLSLEWTTAVNDASRTLKNPLRRALYLLMLHGIDLEKQAATGNRVSPEFLEEVMEQREALGLAKARGDMGTVRELAEQAHERGAVELAHLASAFAEFSRTQKHEALHRAAGTAAVLKYIQRFEEEVEAIEMEALDSE